MSHDTPSKSGLSPEVKRIIAVVIMGPFMTNIDATVVNLSLSSIRDALHSSISSAQWLISGYLLALALTLPLNGWLVERVGAKKLYLACFSAFTASSALCGMATTMEQLIAARVLQGMAGGLLAPMTQMMIARAAGAQMARAMAIGSAPILIGPLLGPALAGAILKHASWPWLFFINLPVGVVAVGAAAMLLPADALAEGRRRFDMAGFLLISPGLAGTLYGLEEIIHGRGALFLPLGLTSLAAFFWHARRAGPQALIDLSLFKVGKFAVAAQTQFLNNGVVYAGQFLVPLYLTMGLGMSAGEAGWLIMAMNVALLCVYPFMGMLTERLGARTLATLGVSVSLAGTLPMVWMSHTHYIPALMVVSMVIRGFGQGAVGIPAATSAYSAIPRERLSSATTAANIVQRLGGPVATTLMSIVIAVVGRTMPGHGPASFTIPFVMLNILQLLVFASANRLPGKVVAEANVVSAAG